MAYVDTGCPLQAPVRTNRPIAAAGATPTAEAATAAEAAAGGAAAAPNLHLSKSCLLKFCGCAKICIRQLTLQ